MNSPSHLCGSVANHVFSGDSCKSASDAAFLADFLNEVGKNNETTLAVQGKAAAPSGNWIHVMSGFRDVVDVLQAQVFASIPVEDMTTRRLLHRELRGFVADCLMKVDGKLYAPRGAIEHFHAEHAITKESMNKDLTRVTTKAWDYLSVVSMHLLARQFHPIVLPQILSRATFLEFDLHSASYKETPVYEALLQLQNEIRRFNFANTSDTLKILFKHSPRAVGRRGTSIDIETVELAGLLHLLDRWSNVLDLATSLFSHLEGAPFKLPALRPDSPIQGFQKMLDKEKVTDEEVSAFMRLRSKDDEPS